MTRAEKAELWLVAGGYCIVLGAGKLVDALRDVERRGERAERRARREREATHAMVVELAGELEKAGVIDMVDDEDGLGARPRAVRRGARVLSDLEDGLAVSEGN